jgi:hypothetical protein
LHVHWHWPFTQTGALAFASVPQMFPQAPQLLKSSFVSTHAFPHCVNPVLQVKPQCPFVQNGAPAFGTVAQA